MKEPFIKGHTLPEVFERTNCWGWLGHGTKLKWGLVFHIDVMVMEHFINTYVHESGAQMRVEVVKGWVGALEKKITVSFWFDGRVYATEEELIVALC